MELSAFLITLFDEGKITVPRTLQAFDADDLDEAAKLIRAQYQREALDMPGQVPAFDGEAAVWAAGYIFRATQFTLLRELDANLMDEWLVQFGGTPTAGAVYSADLLLRYLNGVISLCTRIAPGDPLVDKLKDTASKWPFSSVGLNIEATVPLDVILTDPCLRYAYGDRIIQTRDAGRAKETEQLLAEIMGMHTDTFWPSR